MSSSIHLGLTVKSECLKCDDLQLHDFVNAEILKASVVRSYIAYAVQLFLLWNLFSRAYHKNTLVQTGTDFTHLKIQINPLYVVQVVKSVLN